MKERPSDKWLKKKRSIDLIMYCKTLKRKDQKRREDIAKEHFGTDGPGAIRDISRLLEVAYYYIMDTTGKVFGPVLCHLRKCANPRCGKALEPWATGDPLRPCPQCGGTTWITTENAYFWYMTATKKEAAAVISRFMMNAAGNARRIVGGEEYEDFQAKVESSVGMPPRDLIDRPEAKRIEAALTGPLVPCPSCQEKCTDDDKFCPHCGAKLK